MVSGLFINYKTGLFTGLGPYCYPNRLRRRPVSRYPISKALNLGA